MIKWRNGLRKSFQKRLERKQFNILILEPYPQTLSGVINRFNGLRKSFQKRLERKQFNILILEPYPQTLSGVINRRNG
jgi:hypothetical protein